MIHPSTLHNDGGSVGSKKALFLDDSALDTKDVLWCKAVLKLEGLAHHNQQKHELCATEEEDEIKAFNKGIVGGSLIGASISGGGLVSTFIKESALSANKLRAYSLVGMCLSLGVTYASMMMVTPEKLNLVSERRIAAHKYFALKNQIEQLRLEVSQKYIIPEQRNQKLKELQQSKLGIDEQFKNLPTPTDTIYRKSKSIASPPPTGENYMTYNIQLWKDYIRDQTWKRAQDMSKTIEKEQNVNLKK